MGKSAPSATVSTYYAGFHFVLCHTLDSIRQVYLDEKLAWSGTVASGEFTVNAPELLGGNSREGGLVGTFELLPGLPAQTENSYLQSKMNPSGNIPAYRNIVSLVAKQVYWGTNYYLKKFEAVCVRTQTLAGGDTQWQSALAEPVTDFINGVHVLRECFTDPIWGMGISGSLLPDADWIPAAQTCYDEGLAFTFLWNRKNTLSEFMKDVARHIQCVYYQDRVTGEWRITAQRKIADTSSLPIVDSSVFRTITSLSKKTVDKLPSTVIIKFKDWDTNKPDQYKITNTALSLRQNDDVVETIEYTGIPTMAMAQKIGVRDARQLSLPIYSGSIVCNNTVNSLNPGDAFILRSPEELEDDIICRVVNLNLGNITKSNVTIEFIQDFADAADLTYISIPSSGWVTSITDPIDASNVVVFEAPYYEVALQEGDQFAQGVDPLTTYIAVGASSPSGDSYSAGVWSTTASDYKRKTTLDFCFTAVLTSSIGRASTDTILNIGSIIDIELLELDNWIQIDDEILEVTAIGSSTLTVTRGCLDTIPAAHSNGARIYGLGSFSVGEGTNWLVGETVKVKITPKTPKAELDIADATEHTHLTVGRMHLPYPPANLKFNGSYWISSATRGDIVLTWAYRNRLTQTAGLIDWYSGSVTTEPSVTYSGELKTSGGSPILSFTGVASNTTTLDTAPLVAASVSHLHFSGTTADLHFGSAHGLSIGDTIQVSGAASPDDIYYNGTFLVDTVPSSSSLTYIMSGTPSANATGTLVIRHVLYLGTVVLTIRSTNANGDSFQEVTHTFDII